MMKLVFKCIAGLKRFRGDKSGVAAVEFALFAPFLMVAVLTMSEVGLMAFDKMKLTSGVRSASQYVLTGGEDDVVISSLISSGSGLDSAKLSVAITTYCNCAADGIVAECFSNCSDNDTPRTYRHIEATTTSERLFKPWIISSAAEVRTR